MSTDTCFADTELDCDVLDSEVKLSEDEMVTLFMNMIAFDGDWEAHLRFLEGLDPLVHWKFEQLPLVESLQKKDLIYGIQAAIS
ncbi:MAG: hypothetical protein KJ645_00200 [Planctomycetes bacterium]|nr:hypothetical protein [Planctomycetota bacterium]